MAGPERHHLRQGWTLLLIVVGGCVLSAPGHEEDGELVLAITRPVAEEVYFVSSLDRFTAHPLRKEGRDTWVWRGKGDAPFSYFFLVDGEVDLPECALTVEDDFGEKNCIYVPAL